MARDPKRIDNVLARLKAAWENYPELRLGQIIVNATYDPNNGEDLNAIFYVEDEELIKTIESELPPPQI